MFYQQSELWFLETYAAFAYFLTSFYRQKRSEVLLLNWKGIFIERIAPDILLWHFKAV